MRSMLTLLMRESSMPGIPLRRLLRQDMVMQELDSWLSILAAIWGLTLQSCTPTDILAFLELSWLHKHAGTYLPDGSHVAFPSGVNL